MKIRDLIKGPLKKKYMPPGTPVYLGEEKTEPVNITVIDYDAENFRQSRPESPDKCRPFRDLPTVTWINVDGIHDTGIVKSLADDFGLHTLVHEDILNTSQRAKMEDFGEYIFIVLKMLQWNQARDEMTVEQVSLVLGRNFVLSFQQRPGDVFESIRQRIRNSQGRIRRMSGDYLACCLLDAVVDGYFIVLEKISDKLETLENRTMTHPTPRMLGEIHHLRREGLFLRRAVWPVREMISSLQRVESPLVSGNIKLYIRDVYDHAIQSIDTAETCREMLSSLRDTYMSSISNRTNEVMRVLTIIATIFIPLTFIAGIYGMNFETGASPLNMPELKWYFGYPAALAVMAVVALIMIMYFRKKRWL